MKKILCIFAALLIVLGAAFFGCGKKNDKVAAEQSETAAPTTESTTAPDPKPVLSGDAALNDGETYTGRDPLPLVDFNVSDPENTRGLSTEKHGYGYGIAKDGKPNDISVNNQKYFETNGYKALCLDTKSTDKVLYLTFDCGYENGYTAKILDTLKEKQVTAAFFCTLPQVKENPEIIARMINEGHIVGNHSVTHPSFPTLTRLQMANEIKGMDDYLRTYFGYSAPFFRFPMGEYSDSALDAVGSLGYTSVFWSVAYSDWDLKKQKGEEFAFNTVMSRMHPGAVILLHAVSPDNAAALGRIIDSAREQGYTFKSLYDYPQE